MVTVALPLPSVDPFTDVIVDGADGTTLNAFGRTYRSPFNVIAKATGV